MQYVFKPYCFKKIKSKHSIHLKDVSTPDFSTPSFNPGPFNPRLFNHEFLNQGVEKFMVEKSGVEMSGVEKFMVQKSGLERSGVEAWGWKVWGWNVLQPFALDKTKYSYKTIFKILVQKCPMGLKDFSVWFWMWFDKLNFVFNQDIIHRRMFFFWCQMKWKLSLGRIIVKMLCL